jgi:hypothetical protein
MFPHGREETGSGGCSGEDLVWGRWNGLEENEDRGMEGIGHNGRAAVLLHPPFFLFFFGVDGGCVLTCRKRI